MTTSPTCKNGPGAVSASSPLVDFSTSTEGAGIKNPKSTVIFPLSSSALSASSLPTMLEFTPFGSPSFVSVNVPEVCIFPAELAILESFSPSLLSAVVCVVLGAYPAGISTCTL